MNETLKHIHNHVEKPKKKTRKEDGGTGKQTDRDRYTEVHIQWFSFQQTVTTTNIYW